jgi:hypothetical protein
MRYNNIFYNNNLIKKMYSKNIKYNFFLNYILNQKLSSYFKKLRLSNYQKLFYYYNFKNHLHIFTHKAFLMFEMQLNALLVRTKLVPYFHVAAQLCYFQIVQVNYIYVRNFHYLINLYDHIQLPIFLFQQFYYKQYQIHLLPFIIKKLYQKYWKYSLNLTTNKIWLINNFVTSNLIAQSIIFEYPNINLYQNPFRRFTNIFYQASPQPAQFQQRYLNNTYYLLKLKIFHTANFYK